MIAFAISFISGIAVFKFFPFFPVLISFFVIVISGLLFIRQQTAKRISLIVFIFAFGVLYSFIRQATPATLVLPESEISVQGVIIDVPEMINGKIRFTIDRVSIDGKEITGKVRLFLSGEPAINKEIILASGKRVNAFAKLRPPNVLHNPGVYSYDPGKDGIIALGYIKELRLTGEKKDLLSWIQNRRHLLSNIFDSSLSAENAALHKAIILGLTGSINQGMRDSFSVTGLAHILSISGTHFGLLAFIIFKLIKLIIKRLPARILSRMTLYITPTQTAVLITLPILVLYALISGMSTPAVRSLIMISIYMLAVYLGRKDQWLNSLSIAAFIILLYQPAALFDLSFQLSFIAVLSIGYAAESRTEAGGQKTKSRGQSIPPSPIYQGDPVNEKRLERMKGKFKLAAEKTKTASLMTIAAVLGTAPLVALSFKQFPLISPVSNLIVAPFICFIILPLGFFGSFSALIFRSASMPLNGLTDAATRFALQLIKMFSQLPYSNLHVPNPSPVLILLYFISLFLIVKYSSKWKFLPLILVICSYIATPYFSGNGLKITFLDVGQGDASAVELPDGKIMLIDGGTYEPDTGRSVIAPFLWSHGMKSIDYLVMTHPHPDHFGGLIYMMENFRIGEIWLNGRRTFESEIFFQKMKEKNVPYKVLRRGDVLTADKYKIYVFHPFAEFFTSSPRGEFSDENSASLVLKVESGNASILFTGDIETEAEQSLTPLGSWIKSDIIKVPHHGGRSSSSMEFLKTVSPQTAVISVGRNNSFNHPHDETIQKYNNAGARIYRTDTDGAVTVTLSRNPTASPRNRVVSTFSKVGLNAYPPLIKGGEGGFPYDVKTYWDTEFKKVEGWRDEVRNLRLLLLPC